MPRRAERTIDLRRGSLRQANFEMTKFPFSCRIPSLVARVAYELAENVLSPAPVAPAWSPVAPGAARLGAPICASSHLVPARCGTGGLAHRTATSGGDGSPPQTSCPCKCERVNYRYRSTHTASPNECIVRGNLRPRPRRPFCSLSLACLPCLPPTLFSRAWQVPPSPRHLEAALGPLSPPPCAPLWRGS